MMLIRHSESASLATPAPGKPGSPYDFELDGGDVRLRSECDVPSKGVYLSESEQVQEYQASTIPIACQLRSHPVHAVKDIDVNVRDGKMDDVAIAFIGSCRAG